MGLVLLEELNCDLAMIIEHSASYKDDMFLDKSQSLFILRIYTNKSDVTLFRHYNALVETN